MVAKDAQGMAHEGDRSHLGAWRRERESVAQGDLQGQQADDLRPVPQELALKIHFPRTHACTFTRHSLTHTCVLPSVVLLVEHVPSTALVTFS